MWAGPASVTHIVIGHRYKNSQSQLLYCEKEILKPVYDYPSHTSAYISVRPAHILYDLIFSINTKNSNNWIKISIPKSLLR